MIGFGAPALVFADDSWQINNFASNLTVQQDGKVDITETIDVDFGIQAKHGIYRDLPFVYSDDNGNKTYTDISVKEVAMDASSIPYDIRKNDANLRIKIGDSNKTITGKHSYTVHYVATGVLRSFNNYDELYWNVTGEEWPVEIKQASATVTLPKPGVVQFACYWGVYGSATNCIAQKVDDTTVRYSTSEPLPTGSGLTVAAGFTSGMVPIITVPAPPTILEQLRSPAFLGSFVVTLLLGITLIWRRWWKEGRDYWYGHHAVPDGQARQIPFGVRESIAPEFESPAKLQPAELGTLVDERADTLDVTATIVDLAVRGYLTIAEEKKKWAFGSSDYTLKQKKISTKDLLKYEELLLGALFASGTEVKLSALKNTFYDDLAKVKHALYDEVVKKDLFTKNPESIRNIYYGIGIGVLVLAGVMGGFTISAGELSSVWFWIVMGVATGLFMTAIVILAGAHAMPARTAKGRMLYRQSLGYKLFISKAEKYRAQFMEKENLFETVLPYAIVFGVTDQLARAMKVLEFKPTQPGWYYGTHPFSPAVFASDMQGFSSTLSSAMASTPSSSGASGGGFSGGGFGGGGGGSW